MTTRQALRDKQLFVPGLTRPPNPTPKEAKVPTRRAGFVPRSHRTRALPQQDEQGIKPLDLFAFGQQFRGSDEARSPTRPPPPSSTPRVALFPPLVDGGRSVRIPDSVSRA